MYLAAVFAREVAVATELTTRSKWIQAIAVGVFVTVLNQAREWAGLPHSLLTFLMTIVILIPFIYGTRWLLSRRAGAQT